MKTSMTDLLYNQKSICEEYALSGHQQALELIKEKYLSVTEAYPRHCENYLNTLLNSLNESLYHYVLFTTEIHSSEKIFSPFVPSDKEDMTEEGFLKKAGDILSKYEPCFSRSASSNKHITDACLFIREHLNENLTLEKVASCIYVNRCHLCHLFKSCLSMKFSEYITNERNALAKTLLCDNGLSIDDVAEKCGFSSSSYFSTVFKKSTGLSPREYRKQKIA